MAHSDEVLVMQQKGCEVEARTIASLHPWARLRHLLGNFLLLVCVFVGKVQCMSSIGNSKTDLNTSRSMYNCKGSGSIYKISSATKKWFHHATSNSDQESHTQTSIEPPIFGCGDFVKIERSEMLRGKHLKHSLCMTSVQVNAKVHKCRYYMCLIATLIVNIFALKNDNFISYKP